MGTKDTKPKYSTANTVLFTMRQVLIRDPLILFIYGVHVLMNLAFDLIGIFFLPKLIEALEQGASAEKVIRIVVFFVSGMLLTNIAARLMNQLYWPRMSRLRTKIAQGLDEKMLNMKYERFENPAEQNRYQNANSTISTPYGGFSGTFLYSFELADEVIAFLAYLAMSLYINYFLFALVAVTVAVNYYLTGKANRAGYANTVQMGRYDRELDWLNRGMTEDSHAKDMRLYAMFPWFQFRTEKAFLAKKELKEENLRIRLKLSVKSNLLKLICDAAIYGMLIWQVLRGLLTLADFSLQFSVINAATGRINRMIQNVLKLQEFNLAMNDYRSLIDDGQENVEIDEVLFKELQERLDTDEASASNQQENVETAADLSREWKHSSVKIEFREVSFCYPNTEKEVLHNLTFTIEPGERISLVGENGAGKSTVVKLLCRLYVPTSGEIYVDGVNYLEYSWTVYRQLLSVVFQEVVAYGFMIAENVSMRPEAVSDGEKVTAALRKAGLAEKIASLPDREKTHLVKRLYEDAVELSGGEAQKLAISRALFKDSPIVVLDEPTAALDAFVEDQIYQSFAEMTAGKTAVFISHRLASTKFCDKIIMLREGRVEGIGNHRELMEACPLYAELYGMQVSGYVDGRV